MKHILRKQLLLKLGVFLLLGAVVNVAVAWVCAAWAIPRSEHTKFIGLSGNEAPCWLVSEATRFGNRILMTGSSGNHIFYQMFETQTDVIDPEIVSQMLRGRVDVPDGCGQQCFRSWHSNGWPCLALECERDGSFDLSIRLSFQSNLYAGVPLAPGASSDCVMRDRALPFRFIWPGFAINTIFYAAMLWLLWFAPGRIKRFFRMRGHRCPACGYQIAPGGGIGPVCSECGAQLPLFFTD
jgi:hypothetical protein